MFLWFVGLSWLIVHLVFQSPASDLRIVMAGSVLPLLDAVTGGPWVLHTLVGSVAALAAVMFATRGRGRRLQRRRWLGVPIGMFVHLVLDGAWASTTVFWWPFFGLSFAGESLPEARPVVVVLLMEAAGLAGLVWGARRFRLDDRGARHRFLTTGRVDG